MVSCIVTKAEPSAKPKQDIFVTDNSASISSKTVTVAVSITVIPNASVTVII